MQMPQPNAGILARKPQIVAALRALLPHDAVIDDPRETKAYECDALAAYRCMPLAVVLPRNTQEVAAALKTCAQMGVPVVPRGAGTSLAGGSMPSEDAVVLGLARMNAVLEVDYTDRVIKVEAGRTNLSVTGAIEGDGWFYAPDPSSQLACAISGNIAMNSGGAHCLKYGVTTNNLLGVTLVLVYLDWRPIVFAAVLFALHHVLFDRLQAAGLGLYCLTEPDFGRVVIHAVYVVIQTALEVMMAVSLALVRQARRLALGDALRLELAPFGIRVLEVQPGAIASSFGSNASAQAEQLLDEASPWWPIRDGIRARANASQDNPTPTSHFARNLLAAVQRDKRPRLLRLGNGSRSMPLMAALVPKALLEKVLKKRFGLDRSL